MAISESSNAIRSLVDELRSLDHEFRVFGSKKSSNWGHGYQLNRVIDEPYVEAFEIQHGIKLPCDYRKFLVEVGNGGAGPYYGINTLQDSAEFSSLEAPFPWSHETIRLTDAEYDTWCELPGVLVLAEQGCGLKSFLVVNGQAHGQIWDNGDGGVVILRNCTFTDWYMEWVIRCIQTIRREPLIDKVRVGMTKDDVQAILGSDIQQWTLESRFPGLFQAGRNPDDPSYYMGFTNTNATFGMSEDDRVLKINKMESVW